MSKKSTNQEDKSDTQTLSSAFQEILDAYKKQTPISLRLMDLYMIFCVILGVSQFVYCFTIGTYPYNAFLAGFGSSVASFVLTDPAQK
ncbi:hypothetical protein BB559_002737 [Furculomyces boomerangus]|uniref:Dolichyl-diphosphooligosaccharide--protein glycosyltransferase subunit OST2 n=1 Tax=Furculomyces boomerangus TaxID=61424 RepID=A0A2T9YT48_9FUNG|nr:hypothetical protein BB559_002737 [Furculomyces boomerangus]